MPMLPNGYTELEYIQSTGTQYIDLGFKANQTTKAICKFNYQPKLESQSYGLVFGYRVLYKVKQFNAWDYSDDQASKGIRVDYANAENAYSVNMLGTTGILTVGQDYTFELGHAYFNCPELNIANYQFIYTGSQDDFEGLGNLYLFCLNNNGTAQWFTGSRIKSFYAEHNGTPIINLIPALRQSDNAIGMYDLVSNTFFTNAGTGVFIAGPVKAVSAGKVLARGNNSSASSLTTVAVKPILPSGYKRLEYIQSDGASWIDTSFKPNNNTKTEVVFQGTNLQSWKNIFGTLGGVSGSNKCYFLGTWESTNRAYCWFGGSKQNQFYMNWTTKYTAILDGVNHSLSLNGTIINHEQSTFQSNYNMMIFTTSDYDGSVLSGSVIKCWSFKIYDNSTLARNFIPSQRLSDSAIGMYDLVSNTFFTNQGSGSFTAGPEVSNYEKVVSLKTIVRN